jgi:hypothetical protein
MLDATGIYYVQLFAMLLNPCLGTDASTPADFSARLAE